MALIPYLESGASITADKLNLIWAELDRKLCALLDNHSIFYWQYRNLGDAAPWLAFTGQKFFFLDALPGEFPTAPTCQQCRLLFADPNDSVNFKLRSLVGIVANYNHGATVPYNYGPSATEPHRDDNQKIFCIDQESGYNPEDSLAVARATVDIPEEGKPSIVGYSLWDRSRSSSPPRVLAYDVAELIFEGVTEFDFPAGYDRFNFFRIHNLNATPLYLYFIGTDGESKYGALVPAYSSRCVRRTTVDSGYEEGFHHFWKVHKGDPRTYSDSRAANNVLNPKLAIDIVRAANKGFRNRGGIENMGATWFFDMSRVWDASSLYCGEGKPFAAIEDTTLVGDLLVHKGELLNLRSEDGTQWTRDKIQFDGFANWVENFEAHGFTVNESAMSITGTTYNDLVSISTNLLTAVGGPVQGAITAIALPQFQIPSVPMPWQGYEMTTVYNYAGGSVNFVATGFQATVSGASILRLDKTLTEVKTLNPILGVSAYTGTNQDTPLATQTDRALCMTGFGLALSWNLNIPLTRDPAELCDGYYEGSTPRRHIINPLGNRAINDSATLITPVWMAFDGYGWPRFLEDSAPFFSPRKPVYFYQMRQVPIPQIYPEYAPTSTIHALTLKPDWTYYFERTPLADSTPRKIEDRRTKGSIRILCPWADSSVYSMLAAFIDKTKLQVVDQFNAATTYDFLNELDTIPEGDTTSNTAWGTIRAAMLASYSGYEFTSDGLIQLLGTRAQLLVDHYNNIASTVNAISKVEPLNVFNLLPIEPNEFGIFGTTVRPKNQFYATNDPYDYCVPWFTALGVAQKTEADFSGTLAEFLTVKSLYKQVTVNASLSLSAGADVLNKDVISANWHYDANYMPTTPWHYTDPNDYYSAPIEGLDYRIYATKPYVLQCSIASASISEATATGDTIYNSSDGLLWRDLFSGTLSGSTETGREHYRWYAVEDVKSGVEAIGLKFKFNRIAVPISIQYSDSTSDVATMTHSDVIRVNGSYPSPTSYLDHYDFVRIESVPLGEPLAYRIDAVMNQVSNCYRFQTAEQRDYVLANAATALVGKTPWVKIRHCDLVADPEGDWIMEANGNNRIKQNTYTGQTTLVLDTDNLPDPDPDDLIPGFLVSGAVVSLPQPLFSDVALSWQMWIAGRVIQRISYTQTLSYPDFAPDRANGCLAFQDASSTATTAKAVIVPAPYLVFGNDGAATFATSSGTPVVQIITSSIVIEPQHTADTVTVFLDHQTV